jgi:flagellar protein FlgJ
MTGAITDFTQFTNLRLAAERNDPAVLREVAGQFEALFIETMLKNMREASLGDPLLGDSNQHEMYQGMLDQQLSLEMSSGKGIGLAEMLVRQLGGESQDLPVPPAGGFRLPASRLASPAPVASVSAYVPAAPVMPAPPVASATPKPMWSDAEAFAQDIWPHAERAARRLNVSPEAIVAQAALETGWGAHVPHAEDGRSSFNLFGIKVSRGWSGDSVTKPTLEFENGLPRPQLAEFRAYNNVAATFEDYSAMLKQNPRYAAVSDHGDDIEGFARALQSSGYATDPAYAQKLKAVADGETMQKAISNLKNSASRSIALRQLSDAI